MAWLESGPPRWKQVDLISTNVESIYEIYVKEIQWHSLHNTWRKIEKINAGHISKSVKMTLRKYAPNPWACLIRDVHL